MTSLTLTQSAQMTLVYYALYCPFPLSLIVLVDSKGIEWKHIAPSTLLFSMTRCLPLVNGTECNAEHCIYEGYVLGNRLIGQVYQREEPLNSPEAFHMSDIRVGEFQMLQQLRKSPPPSATPALTEETLAVPAQAPFAGLGDA